ncbi:MAG: zeta toxin family protein [Alphaproteobacteria bacterium]|nr:zeta toxin family protein [Alphaproteobacteria bacterium]
MFTKLYTTKKNINKNKILRQKEAYQYKERIKERDRKALEIITKRHFDADSLYQEVADKSVFLSGEMKEDIALLCETIGIKNNLSAEAKQNDTYTNSIRSIISGIDEVVPYTYDDEQYTYQQYFNPIIEKVLNEAPSSDKPKLIHMLGIPSAGKTTFYKNYQNEFKDYVLIGFDLIMEKVPQYHSDREEIGKMEAFKKWELPARIAGYELLRQAIAEKKNIFFHMHKN